MEKPGDCPHGSYDPKEKCISTALLLPCSSNCVQQFHNEKAHSGNNCLCLPVKTTIIRKSPKILTNLILM